MDKITINIEM